jgi:hypothetical protein
MDLDLGWRCSSCSFLRHFWELWLRKRRLKEYRKLVSNVGVEIEVSVSSITQLRQRISNFTIFGWLIYRIYVSDGKRLE